MKRIKKNNSKLIVFILIILLFISIGYGMLYSNLSISGEVTIDITSYYAMLLPGKEFNVRLKRIAGNEMATYESFDDSILEIKRSLNPPPNGITLDIISTDDSPYIVTAWFDEGIIYWYTEALKVCFNEDASYMFNRLYNVTNIELSDFDTSKTISMESLFNICGSLRRVDLSTFNTWRECFQSLSWKDNVC